MFWLLRLEVKKSQIFPRILCHGGADTFFTDTFFANYVKAISLNLAIRSLNSSVATKLGLPRFAKYETRRYYFPVSQYIAKLREISRNGFRRNLAKLREISRNFVLNRFAKFRKTSYKEKLLTESRFKETASQDFYLRFYPSPALFRRCHRQTKFFYIRLKTKKAFF
jgi:hypothetical protein